MTSFNYYTVVPKQSHVFSVTSWFEINNEVASVKTDTPDNQKEFSEEDIYTYAMTLYPLIFGLDVHNQNRDVYVNSMTHVIPLVEKYHAKLSFINQTDDEIVQALEAFKEKTFIPQGALFQVILKQCNTPKPTFTPYPTAAEPQLPEQPVE